MHLLVGGPARAWIVFLACEEYKKTLNFLRCIHVFDLVLKYGSDINEGNWLQVLFYFIVLKGVNTVVVGIGFFSALLRVLGWSFLLLHFDGNVCNWIPKVIWPRMDWFWFFFVGKWLLSSILYLYEVNSLRDAQLLFYFDKVNFFSVFRVTGILVCSSKMLFLFFLSKRIL